MLSLLISTIVFLVVAWYLNRYLDEQGISKGMTRGTLVLVLASLVSWAVGLVVGWAEVKIEGPQPASHTAGDLSRLLKEIGQSKP